MSGSGRIAALKITWGLAVAGWLCCGSALAQTKSGERVDPPISVENFPPKPGAPLSQRALVTLPPPIKGVVSWTIETKRIRYRYSVTALSPDGKLVATGGIDGIIRIWEVETGKLVRALVGHDSYVYGLAFSPGGRYLASGGAFDYTARIWEVATGQPLRVLKGHPNWVSQVAWSGDGKKLIAEGGTSGDLSVWNVETGLKTAKGSLGQVILSLTADPTGDRFAAVTTESAVVVVNSKTGKGERNLGAAVDKCMRLAWSPDGKVIAAGSAKGTLLFDPDTGKVEGKLDATGHALDWSRDGSRLAAASADGTLQLWNPTDRTLIHKLTGSATSLHLLPGEGGVVAGDTVGLATYQWAGGKRTGYRDITDVVPPIWQPGRPVVTGVQTTSLSLWDPGTGHLKVKLDGHTAAIAAYAFSPDGKAIVTASHDKTLRVYEVSSGSLKHTLTKHTAPVLCVAWSGGEGKEIVSGGQDKKTIVWDAKSGEATHTLADHAAAITCLAFSPGGTLVAAAGDDGKVFTYTRPGWKTAARLATPNQTHALSLAWTPDGKTLAVGDINGTALLWSTAKAKPMGELPTVGSPPQINSMVFIAKGEVLATARGNHTLVLWSTSTGKSTHTLPTMAPAQHVVWAAPHLAVASQDRCCRFFEPISGRLRGMLIAEPEQIVALSHDGHYRADGPTVDGLVYVVQTPRGQDTLSPAEFAAQYKWKNDPAQARFAGK
jgi:WD40 repeat protein